MDVSTDKYFSKMEPSKWLNWVQKQHQLAPHPLRRPNRSPQTNASQSAAPNPLSRSHDRHTVLPADGGHPIPRAHVLRPIWTEKTRSGASLWLGEATLVNTRANGGSGLEAP